MDENVDIAAVANSQILRASSLSASATAYAQAMQSNTYQVPMTQQISKKKMAEPSRLMYETLLTIKSI
jgi:hypothetical protein